MHYRNFDQVLLCIFNSFGDSFLYFFGLTQTMTNHTILIANNHQCRKTESTTTFGCFYHTVDGNNFIFQFQVACFYSVYINF